MATVLLHKISMKKFTAKKPARPSWISVPPWFILGAFLVLAPIFIFTTVERIHRQKENATRLMLAKGAALIRSFEAGTRTGMMGMAWGSLHLQRLLTETAQQPDIAYLLVTDEAGTILAHSDLDQIGKTHGSDLDLKQASRLREASWRQLSAPDGGKVFEVYRQFTPARRPPHMHYRGMMRPAPPPEALDPLMGMRQIIFVGLDMGPVELARRQDMRHTIFMGAILLLIGFAGFVSIYLTQAYRQAKSSLSEIKALSDNVLENMPIGVLALNRIGKIASLNQTAAALLGLSPREVVSANPEEKLPSPLMDLIRELRAGERVIEREVDCPFSTGKNVPLDVMGTPLLNDEGDFLGHVVLFRDLSEIRQLKEEVARSQRLASIGKLAAGVAHEIRNPLSSIKGLATYFKERYRDVAEDQQTAEIMIQEVERLNRVIGQLLEFARPMSLQKRPTPLKTLVQQTLSMIDGDARKRGVEIAFHADPGLEQVPLDPDRIRQVLLNLFLNALEAVGDGGRLAVEIRHDEERRQVRLIVNDNGTGIDKEDLTHIFDPYFTTKPGGTGLGLAIVHKIVEAHGGEVHVKSHRGEGTSVTVSLPFHGEDAVS